MFLLWNEIGKLDLKDYELGTETERKEKKDKPTNMRPLALHGVSGVWEDSVRDMEKCFGRGSTASPDMWELTTQNHDNCMRMA